MLLSVAVIVSVLIYLSEPGDGRLGSPCDKIFIGFMSLILGATFYMAGLTAAELLVDHRLIGKQAKTLKQEVVALEGKPN
jgi:uncharacterized protein (DUF2164 family)